ncbi:MAG: coenzyme F420-0:L-glutamate ligase [Candidatus Binatia bacterium]|nr:coenzyme F420-0:L-glutamate ligase [Candidatus Binatia bacterium]
MSVVFSPLQCLPRVQPGDELAALLLEALRTCGLLLKDGDILVVCQKVVSKSEGSIVDLSQVVPSPAARTLAAGSQDKDPRVVEVVLRESNRIVRAHRGVLIVETGPGWVCANAGVDESNAPGPNTAVLLPRDPDASAERIRSQLQQRSGAEIAVIISDTWGRPWRNGLVDFAIGLAGIGPLSDWRGKRDLNGRVLHHTVYAQADALAAAAGLLMKKDAGVAAVHIRGYEWSPEPQASARALIRAPEEDLFR